MLLFGGEAIVGVGDRDRDGEGCGCGSSGVFDLDLAFCFATLGCFAVLFFFGFVTFFFASTGSSSITTASVDALRFSLFLRCGVWKCIVKAHTLI